MIIDYIEALGVLEHAGIRVVRAKYVDSAQDAVGFATRREARDPRVMPIVLRCVPGDATAAESNPPANGALHTSEAIQAAHARLAAPAGAVSRRILAQEYVESGTDVAITYRAEESGQKYVELRVGDHGTEQLLPIDGTGVRILVENMFGYAHRGRSEKSRRMLEHLILRVCGLLDEFAIDTLELDPVRLHENTYTVIGATIGAASRLHAGKRLSRHAHDRKAYGYRPSGRQ